MAYIELETTHQLVLVSNTGKRTLPPSTAVTSPPRFARSSRNVILKHYTNTVSGR
jgi:hypothetical protein